MKLGLIGLGHLGKIHFRCLKETPFDLIGIYDPAFADSYESIKVYDRLEDLISESEACLIAAPTQEHFDIAAMVINQGKHCFVEKPLASTMKQATELDAIAARNSKLITQVGFVERYNPAFTFLEPEINNPKFIEVHRLAQFNERGNDVSVVFDLMIHDLDLLLTMKSSKVKEIRATGVKVFTDTLDICNCRIEFEDKSVANLTASRMSMKVMRKFRIFQDNCYLSMDLSKKESQVIKLSDTELENSMAIKVGDRSKHLVLKSSGTLEGNAILSEQKYFYNAIVTKKQSKANFRNALVTTELAHRIESIAMSSIT